MYQFIGCTQARTHTQREIETRTETRMLFFLSLAYTKVTVVGTTHPTQVHRALGNGDREAGKQEQRWQKIIVSQKSRDGKKNQGSDESRWRRAKKRGKKFNLVFVVFLLCKTNLCKKKIVYISGRWAGDGERRWSRNRIARLIRDSHFPLTTLIRPTNHCNEERT